MNPKALVVLNEILLSGAVKSSMGKQENENGELKLEDKM